LEAEAEKRRKRIEAWQALKRKQAEDDAQANGERAPSRVPHLLEHNCSRRHAAPDDHAGLTS
jgi:hypothetical protein